MTIRVARIVRLEGPEGLEIQSEEPNEPAAGEVRVAMEALGLNRAEALMARGEYLLTPELPARIGIEGAGTISATGEGVDAAVGDRVAVFCAAALDRYGTAADEIVVPASLLFPNVPYLSSEELAAYWMAYLTAYGGMVQSGGLKEAEHVLVTAASSSVGLAAIDVAKRVGATVTASTRRSEKAARLREAGADHIALLGADGIPEDAGPFNLVFDAIGGAFPGTLGSQLAPGARIVVYGILAGEMHAAFPIFAAAEKDIRMTGFHLGYHLLASEERRSDAFGWLAAAGAERPFAPAIDSTFELADLADAYRALEASQQVGKVVVRVDRRRQS
ncbi:MAG: zinc-binding dehydrogenase [Myxococcota bacterium]